jgi:hypothetical protein
MTNCVFANAVYGWIVNDRLSEDEIAVVADFQELLAANEHEHLTKKQKNRLDKAEKLHQDLVHRLLNEFGFVTNPGNTVSLGMVVGADPGSATDDGAVYFGIGFPSIVETAVTYPVVVQHMHTKDAQWHSWVTCEY